MSWKLTRPPRWLRYTLSGSNETVITLFLFETRQIHKIRMSHWSDNILLILTLW